MVRRRVRRKVRRRVRRKVRRRVRRKVRRMVRRISKNSSEIIGTFSSSPNQGETMRKWRWVTADDRYRELICIWYSVKKPAWNDGQQMWEQGQDSGIDVCADEFKRLTGITVPKDKPIKVEFTAKVVE